MEELIKGYANLTLLVFSVTIIISPINLDIRMVERMYHSKISMNLITAARDFDVSASQMQQPFAMNIWLVPVYG